MVPDPNTQYIIHVQSKIFLDNLTKGFSDTVKRKGRRYILSRSPRCISGRVP